MAFFREIRKSAKFLKLTVAKTSVPSFFLWQSFCLKLDE